MADLHEERVPTAGYETHLFRAGAGNSPTVLLLHGGGPGAQAWSNWRPTLASLGEHLDVVAPDLVGFGETSHPDPVPYGPAAWIALRMEQLLAIMDHLGVDRADLVGNSLGGALTLNMAIHHPDRVRRMVLMGSGGPPFQVGPELMALLTFYDDPTAERLRGVLESFVYDLDGFGDVGQIVDARLEQALRPEVRRSFAAMFRSETGEPVGELALPDEAVRGIEHPALIVHGREDRIIPPAASTWLHDRLPNSDLAVLGHCGHWAMLERPRTFARLVRDFVGAEEEVAAR